MDKEFKLTKEQEYFIQYVITFDIFQTYDCKFRSLYPDGYLTTMSERGTYFESDRPILAEMRKECIESANENRWKLLLKQQKEDG